MCCMHVCMTTLCDNYYSGHIDSSKRRQTGVYASICQSVGHLSARFSRLGNPDTHWLSHGSIWHSQHVFLPSIREPLFHTLYCCCVLACPATHWGQNCESICRCEACDNVVGCTSCGGLYKGWKGPNCDEDVNECEEMMLACGANANCFNTNGSYICECHNWFQRISDKCVCKY